MIFIIKQYLIIDEKKPNIPLAFFNNNMKKYQKKF